MAAQRNILILEDTIPEENVMNRMLLKFPSIRYMPLNLSIKMVHTETVLRGFLPLKAFVIYIYLEITCVFFSCYSALCYRNISHTLCLVWEGEQVSLPWQRGLENSSHGDELESESSWWGDPSTHPLFNASPLWVLPIFKGGLSSLVNPF